VLFTPEGGTVVCDEPFAQETPLVVRYNSSDDSHIIVWQDMRSSGKEELRNVYAQSVTIEESAVEQGDLYPGSMVLHQNYPNPFNPNTAIKFTVPEKSNLRISIYDLLGREVRTLVNGRMEAGEFKVDWNGKDNSGHPVSSGIFFCKLESKSLVTGQKYRQTIRVTFIK
jgi:flagellar hook assembly protein FlgD